ncbi:YncE family protein [Brumimicrobium oceani]|uniref:YncE family protein n=1 Tax=Brumimicrobium oceani TaxID=2100725 RepID=A0A2U2XC48_9FLAO|nr:DUF5074 domain-containing protein [Brumimicrobium oceani]PWH85379.1 hypothetical protein DIT68_08940 [Brumimicrobium oceani]
MNSIKYFLITLLFLVSCKKETVEDIPMANSLENGILVLNEGLFQHNNSSLSWVNLATNEAKHEVFLNKNSRPLGDTGNDMIAYGGKIYIAVTGSSTLEVLDRKTLQSIKQIQFNYNNQSQEPRNISFHEGNVFVSSFDGYVSVIDTTALKIQQRIKVGRNPEGLCIQNQSLYVANSGGLDFQNVDTTVFEIDLNSMSVVDTFVVGANPGDMISDDFNNVYVVKRGNYSSDPSELIRINTMDQTVSNLGIPVSTLSKRGNLMYLSYFNHNTASSEVSIFDCSTQSLIDPSFIDNQEITTLYGVEAFKENQIICLDAMSFTNTGYLRFFNQFGNQTKSIQVGLNPNSILHYE